MSRVRFSTALTSGTLVLVLCCHLASTGSGTPLMAKSASVNPAPVPAKRFISVQAADESSPCADLPTGRIPAPAPERFLPISATGASLHTQDSLEIASILAGSENAKSSIQYGGSQHAAGQQLCIAQQRSCDGTEDLCSSTAISSGQLHDTTQLQTPSLTADHDANIATASDSTFSSQTPEVLQQPYSIMQLGQAGLVACLHKFHHCVSQLQQHCQHILKVTLLPEFRLHIKQVAHGANLKLRGMYNHMDSLRTKQLKGWLLSVTPWLLLCFALFDASYHIFFYIYLKLYARRGQAQANNQGLLVTTKPVSRNQDNESGKVYEDLTAQQASRHSAKATAFHYSRNLGRSVVVANFFEQSGIKFTEDSVPGLAVHDQINTGVTKKLLPLLARPPQSRKAPHSLLTAPLTLGAASPSTLPAPTTHIGASLPFVPASNNTLSLGRPPLSGNTEQPAPNLPAALTINTISSSQQQGVVNGRMPSDYAGASKPNQQSARPLSISTADDRPVRRVPAGFQHMAKSGQGPRSAATTAAAAVRQATSGKAAQGLTSIGSTSNIQQQRSSSTDTIQQSQINLAGPVKVAPNQESLQLQAEDAAQPVASRVAVDTLNAEQAADHVQILSASNPLLTECSTPFVAAKSAFAQMQDDRASRKAAARSARDRMGSQHESSMDKQCQQQQLPKRQTQHKKDQAAAIDVESRTKDCLAAELAVEKASGRKLKAELQASNAQRQLLKDENTHLRAYVLQVQRDAAAANKEHQAMLGNVLSQVEKVQAFAAMQAMTPYPSTIRAAPHANVTSAAPTVRMALASTMTPYPSTIRVGPHASTTSTAPTVRVAPASTSGSMRDRRTAFMHSLQLNESSPITPSDRSTSARNSPFVMPRQPQFSPVANRAIQRDLSPKSQPSRRQSHSPIAPSSRKSTAAFRCRSLTCARIEAKLDGMGAGCKSGSTMSDSFARFTMTGKVQSASPVSTATPTGAAVPSKNTNVGSVQASSVHGSSSEDEDLLDQELMKGWEASPTASGAALHSSSDNESLLDEELMKGLEDSPHARSDPSSPARLPEPSPAKSPSYTQPKPSSSSLQSSSSAIAQLSSLVPYEDSDCESDSEAGTVSVCSSSESSETENMSKSARKATPAVLAARRMLTPRRPLLPLQSAKLSNAAKGSSMTAKVTADRPGSDDSFSPALMQMFRTRSTQSFADLSTPTTDFKAAFCSIPSMAFTPHSGLVLGPRAPTLAQTDPAATVSNSAPAVGQELQGCATAEEQQNVDAACAAAVAAALVGGPAATSSPPDITTGSNRWSAAEAGKPSLEQLASLLLIDTPPCTPSGTCGQ